MIMLLILLNINLIDSYHIILFRFYYSIIKQ